MNSANLRALTGHRLFWPCVTLLLLCLLNAWFNPHFFHLDIRGGHLYGSLIDILRLSAHFNDVSDSGKGEVGDLMRPFYLEYLRKHGVTAPDAS